MQLPQDIQLIASRHHTCFANITALPTVLTIVTGYKATLFCALVFPLNKSLESRAEATERRRPRCRRRQLFAMLALRPNIDHGRRPNNLSATPNLPLTPTTTTPVTPTKPATTTTAGYGRQDEKELFELFRIYGSKTESPPIQVATLAAIVVSYRCVR